MKLKTTLCVNLGLYMDIRPEIEIDTDNYEEARRLIKEIHDNFYGLLNGQPREEIDRVNMDLASKKEFAKTDWQMQDLFDKVRKGEVIPVEVWQKLTPNDQNILHKAQLARAAEVRAEKKNENIQNTK